MQLVSFKTKPLNARANPSHAANGAKSPSNHEGADGARKPKPSTAHSAKRESVASPAPLPAPSPRTAEPVTPKPPEPKVTVAVPAEADETSGKGSPGEPHGVPASPRSVEQQVAAAAAKAELNSPPASVDSMDRLMAVLVTRLSVTSLSDLTGKTVAIDDILMGSSGKIRTAIVAAGATEVQLTGGSTIAIDRLLNGEVPAAIVALVSPDAAEAFPEIAGFRTFRVPLSPRSVKEHP